VHRPKLGSFVDTLTASLKHEQPLPLKQRRTAQGMYETLQGEGYRGAYDSVRRFVRTWRTEHQGTPVDAYIPLVFEPGDAFQFDWSHEKIVIAGAMTDVKVAHIRLSHSRFFLTVAYLRESQEMVFDAHEVIAAMHVTLAEINIGSHLRLPSAYESFGRKPEEPQVIVSYSTHSLQIVPAPCVRVVVASTRIRHVPICRSRHRDR